MRTESSITKLQSLARFRKTRLWKSNIPLWCMFVPVLLYFIIFKYAPMGGIIIAFENYNLRQGMLHSPWAGLTYFEMLWRSPEFFRIFRNTLLLSILGFVIGFPFPIMLAVLLNELRRLWYKKLVQTLVYLPHFISMVIVTGIIVTVFASNGIVNEVLKTVFGQTEAYPFLYQVSSWLMIYFGSAIWQEAGFSAIIYLAALSAIDPHLYESAAMDGASKWKQIWHITLPGIRGTIIILLILHMGKLIDVGFDKVYMLSNAAVSDVADVFSTYIYRVGLQGGQFSITAALGLFESVIGLILVLSTNALARKFDRGLF
ncbi:MULTISPECIES: sugar ABC transporter permease [Paenibacillus]|uniref:ABC transporter permease subunit n=1 Tax=Paenibacillus baimaensis TaxID=2982185 RepID=A0ABT2UAG0_9BACL|nr:MULTISPECIES: ABC transporter permease subunit [unclassified Paenibacillus]MCU6791633.1 ABC transporter permease subunit [Paenibacillus sp. WQ 127069]OMF16293.1 protein lplB [Paenibacillus sp. FSL H7-0331]